MSGFARMTIAAALALAISACFFIPGKFDSVMTVDRDGRFDFVYRGEIVMVPSPAALKSEENDFTATCYDDEFEERACSAEEIAEQRAENEQNEATGMAMMKAMTGGIDLADEDSVARFTDRLMKHKGWTSVVHKGDGVFDVVYEISGTLDRDFVWPVFPEMEFVNPYIIASRRTDESVRITAPGFANKEGADMLGPMAAMAAKEDGPKIPDILDGRFTLDTDGEIATNNTEDGAVASGNRQKLGWRITTETKTAPSALIRLTP